MQRMKKIEVRVLNPQVISDSDNMMVAMARLTQRGHSINTMHDLECLLEKPYEPETAENISKLPHPTLQKFGTINIAVVGASRRFLAQITRHQNEVKFMSASLQYSNYTGAAQFVVPYESIEYDVTHKNGISTVNYLNACENSLNAYEGLVRHIGKDAAGYAMPQGLRNVLVIAATPYQWKHMIRQRTCNRNTLETQYVMAIIWEQLSSYSNTFTDCGPTCTTGSCAEGNMSCGKPMKKCTAPSELLDYKFSLLREEYIS